MFVECHGGDSTPSTKYKEIEKKNWVKILVCCCLDFSSYKNDFIIIIIIFSLSFLYLYTFFFLFTVEFSSVDSSLFVHFFDVLLLLLISQNIYIASKLICFFLLRLLFSSF